MSEPGPEQAPAPPPQEATIEPTDEGLLVHFPEEVDIYCGSGIYRAIQAAVDAARAERDPATPFTLRYDLEGVTFMDQVGVNGLVNSLIRAREQGYEFVIRGTTVDRRLRVGLHIIGLDWVLPFDPPLETEKL